MSYRFRPMDEGCARAIGGWHYESIYAFYDMEQDADARAEGGVRLTPATNKKQRPPR